MLPRDPLSMGPKVICSFNLPAALKRELARQAAIDGYDRVSPYLVNMLIAAIRLREIEREQEKSAKHK